MPSHLFLSDLKLCIEQPKLGKCEPLVGDQLKSSSVNLNQQKSQTYCNHFCHQADLSCPLHVASFQLLIDGIVDPEIDVPPPVVLLLGGRHIGHVSMLPSLSVRQTKSNQASKFIGFSFTFSS